ncbi:MAG: DUF4054 domain-containing protein [Janthinobacterium lividum]
MTTPAQFRTDFPEFSDSATYSDASIQMWLTVAASLVNARRWMELTNLGVELVTAHHLAIGSKDFRAATIGGLPGQVSGPMSAKSVDKVSASYDTAAVTEEGAGFWNMSAYGIRYLGLAKMLGAGGLQV